MKWYLPIWIVCLALLACHTQSDSQVEAKDDIPTADTPTFSLKSLNLSFPSQLLPDTLLQAQVFVENELDAVVLISLLPECQVLEDETHCYESTVLSTYDGDSLKSKDLSDLQHIKIDENRFDERKTLHSNDFKKLVPALFSGDKKEAISFCYLPRHAVALYGKDLQLSGFIEICFECSESITLLNGIDIPPLSRKALNEIGAIFLAYGFEDKPSYAEQSKN